MARHRFAPVPGATIVDNPQWRKDGTMTAIMEPTPDAVTAPGPALLSAAEAEAKLIDAAVREARDGAWCEEFDRLMRVTFPARGPGRAWLVDSDGIDKHGYDRDGYDRDGYHHTTGRTRDGYDRAGYDVDGINVDGYDRRGFNRDGVTREGWTVDSPEYLARFRLNSAGYDREGFRRRDLTGEPQRNYATREREADFRARLTAPDPYRFDEYGYDRDGLDRQGRDRNGWTVRGRTDEEIRQQYGYDEHGRDRYGNRR